MMKALRIIKTDSSTSLAVEDVPQPSPQSTDLLVKIHASNILPSDVLNSRGSFPTTTFPRTPGRDFSGTVVSGPGTWQGKQGVRDRFPPIDLDYC